MATSEKNILNRMYLVAGGMFLFALLVAFKLCNIQLAEGDKYKALAEARTERMFTIPANRGNLYAGDGSLLATSVPKYTIRFDALAPKEEDFEENVQALAQGLSDQLGKPASHYVSELRRAREHKNRYLLLARNLGYSKYLAIKKLPLFNKGPYKGGIITEQRTVREHPLEKIAERTIGYDRLTEYGRYSEAGLEGAYGPYLRGKEGRRLKQRIAKGQWKPLGDDNIVEPQDGYDVISTINVNIQDIAHHALLASLEKFEADHGCVVVMETKTGEVKAISNLGRTEDGNYYEDRNYAVYESAEPGSTFKLMAMVAALEDRVIDSSDVVDTENGRVRFYNRTVYDSHWGGYGKISAARAFELSSNTAFAKMINENYKDDPKRFLKRLYNMGLNDKLGLEIKGEGTPRFPYPGDKNWYGTTLPWMAFGYGVSLTPLQTLTFYNAIANNGEMVKPRFIKEIKKWDVSVEKFEKEVINPAICSQTTIDKVKDMMLHVVERGTAQNIYSKEFSMAGKTGTCQTEYWKEEGKYIASFAGYFPAENPEYSCIVVIHKPNKKLGYYGNVVAAPVFRKIAQKIYSDTPLVDEVQLASANVPQVDQDFETYYKKAQKADVTMPNVKGMPAMDAVALLENLGLKVEFNGIGKVKNQSLQAGKKIAKNQKVVLELS
ncbi:MULTISPECIES: penicillin-binding protein [unclassified Leeuwenhoekiella]|uniref:penicillin-binding protein n=1 Tax=unclassified Leeuwenhoekiella TaxID=2615029 RepID=UPI000C3CFAC5|nr:MULTISPECIES: penicillin-binding protein [unclassified Leeuwenhoekiella]MAW96496.1 penicillin-binding protein [Leeuwenhoekiella sp.]MBA81383.1 penicillin-binding protein [Leeuwenhoekiella sp.]|tara:strand:+ start:57031 stop:59022 length:1992 start_codon:yes stop_codon:yes gene_type:complete